MKTKLNNMNNNDNTNTVTVIPFKAIALKNERCVIFDIRCALIDRDNDNLLSLVKAWIHAKDNGVVSDMDVRTTVKALCEVAYHGKLASVKERKDGKTATVDVLSSGRVKAWLYTIRRNGYKAIDIHTEKGDRPEEKATRQVNRKTTVKISAEDKEMFEMIKELKKAGLTTEQMKKWFEVMAC